MDEGFVSRYLNRRFSRPLANLLAPTPVTPNQVTVVSWVVALAAAMAFSTNASALGGVLAQTSSILDGADGDLARAQGTTTPFGAFFDAVLDRYADVAIILGMVFSLDESRPAVWLVGIAAMIGSLMVSYTRARSEASTGIRFGSGLAAFATRDVRLALICLGGIAGEIFWTLAGLALLTNVAVLARIVVVYRTLK